MLNSILFLDSEQQGFENAQAAFYGQNEPPIPMLPGKMFFVLFFLPFPVFFQYRRLNELQKTVLATQKNFAIYFQQYIHCFM